jgi:hypothetical protein
MRLLNNNVKPEQIASIINEIKNTDDKKSSLR